MWWADHEPCDWSWPTSRWIPGQIYRDRYAGRPPPSLPGGTYELVMGLVDVEAVPASEYHRVGEVRVE